MYLHLEYTFPWTKAEILSVLTEFQIFPYKISTSVMDCGFFFFLEWCVSLLSKHTYFSPVKIISSKKCVIPRENPHQIVLQRIWMLYLCWDATWCQVSPSPCKTWPKNPPKHQAAILHGYVLWVHVAVPRVVNSRWSGGEGVSTETVNFCKKACTKCTVVLTHLVFNLHTKQALFYR